MNIAEVYPHAIIPVPDVRLCDALAIVNYEIARRLARDHSVVVYPRRVGGERSIESHEGITWCRIPVRVDLAMNRLKLLDTLGVFPPERPYRLSRFYYASYIAKVAAHVRKRRCEIVHIHSIANFVPVIRRAHPEALVVLHMHDHSLADFDDRLIRPRLRQADLILGCSDLITDEIRTRYPEIGERCHTLHNGVDQRFLETHCNPGESQTVLFVGRLSPEKGVHVLLDAFGALSRDFRKAHLHLVGPSDVAQKQFVDPFGHDRTLREIDPFLAGQSAYRNALKQKMLKLGDRITCEGPRPNSEISSVYARAGIFVFPSVWHEPFGIPLIEAMAVGLPVITTRGGASSEIVVDGETGILVERGDAHGLARAIQTLLADPALRARMGAAGRERVARLFTWDRAVARLTGLYDAARHGTPVSLRTPPTVHAA